MFLAFLHLGIIGVLSFLLWRWHKEKIFWGGLILKLLSGVALGYLYASYYPGGDTWNYFDDGVQVARVISQNPESLLDILWRGDFSAIQHPLKNTQDRSLFAVKWVTVFNLISGDNYLVTSLYFSLFSFAGSWTLYQAISRSFPDRKTEAAISFLLIPSAVFWSSGVIKESLAWPALCVLTASFISWYQRGDLWRSSGKKGFRVDLFFITAVFLSIWILLNIKYYWLAVWLVAVTPVIIISLLKAKIEWVRNNPIWSWLAVVFFPLAAVSLVTPNFYYSNFLVVVVKNYQAYVNLSNPEDVIHFNNLNASVASVLLHAPWAFVSGIFRPFIFEAGNIFQACAALENLMLLVVFIVAIPKIWVYRKQITELHIGLVCYVALLSIFLALSAPNFGSLARYKIGFTPFLWFALLAASGILKRF